MEAHSSRTALLVKLMLPIVRICVRLRIPIQEAYEGLKIAFIEQTSKTLEGTGEKKTLSRISLITGIDRPSVRRIFKDSNFSSAEIPVVSKIIGQWQHDKEFQTKKGTPRELTIGTDDSEFARLVKQVTKNYSPGTVLQDLLIQKVVVVKGDRVRLVHEKTDYSFDSDKGLNLYARNSDTLSQAFEQNENVPSEERNAHLRTEYDNLYVDSLPEIKSWIREEAALFHKKLREFLIKHDSDLSPRPGKVAGGRVVIGTFSAIFDPDKR